MRQVIPILWYTMVALKSDTSYQGFTLVELLIAVFLFSTVIVAVYGTYRTTFHLIDNSTSELDKARSARIAMNRITEDLYGVAGGEYPELIGEKNETSGQRVDTISFIASSYLRISKDDRSRGYAKVQYSSEYDAESETFNLYRASSPVLPGQELDEIDAKKYLLCKMLKSLELTYVDEEGSSEDEWVTDSENRDLPAMIYVKLELGDNTDEENKSSIFTTAVSFSSFVKVEE